MMVIPALGKRCPKTGTDEFEKHCHRGGWWTDASIMELIPRGSLVGFKEVCLGP